MSSLLRSSKTRFFYSSASLSRTFSSLHGFDSTHRNTATASLGNENPSKGNLTGLPKPGGGEFAKPYGLPSLENPLTKLGIDSNKINPMRYKVSGLETNVLAGAGYGIGNSRVWAAKGPMLSGARSVDADRLGLTCHKRLMSDVASATSETKRYNLRPLSPHLPVYQLQLSSALSIFNRISGAVLTGVTLLFYLIYMKVGLISLTFDSFYQFLFYSSKVNLLAIEVSALALLYHLYIGIRHFAHRL